MTMPACFEVPVVQAVMDVMARHGAEARLVGGAVRDLLLGRLPHKAKLDIDMAVNRPIGEAADWLRAAGLAIYETGLAHGTITVRYADQSVELTQTRIDAHTDGRHAEVVATEDWSEDAARRDFTINALYMDAAGTVHDPFDGRADLAAGRLRFIGAPDKRISEDYLRILRAVRFVSELPAFTLDGDSRAALSRHLDGLAGLSGERITNEWMRMLGGAGRWQALRLADEAGIISALFSGVPEAIRVISGPDQAVDMQILADDLPALACLGLCIGPMGAVPDWLRLSRAERDLLARYLQPLTEAQAASLLSNERWQETAYYLGPEAAVRLALHGIWTPAAISAVHISRLLHFDAPSFPLRGADLIDAGMQPGPEMGEMLSHLEAIWVRSGFTLDKAGLLAHLTRQAQKAKPGA